MGLVLLGLAVLLAAGAVVVAVLVAGGGEDAAVVNTHTAEAGEPTLISVSGYAYQALAGDDLARFQESLRGRFHVEQRDVFRRDATPSSVTSASAGPVTVWWPRTARSPSSSLPDESTRTTWTPASSPRMTW